VLACVLLRADTSAAIAVAERLVSVQQAIDVPSTKALSARRVDIAGAASNEEATRTYTIQTLRNPVEVVFDVVLISANAAAMSTIAPMGASSSTQTWWPGYAWRHAHCRRCGAHIGWRYDRTDATCRIPAFFGLTMARPVRAVALSWCFQILLAITSLAARMVSTLALACVLVASRMV